MLGRQSVVDRRNPVTATCQITVEAHQLGVVSAAPGTTVDDDNHGRASARFARTIKVECQSKAVDFSVHMSRPVDLGQGNVRQVGRDERRTPGRQSETVSPLRITERLPEFRGQSPRNWDRPKCRRNEKERRRQMECNGQQSEAHGIIEEPEDEGKQGQPVPPIRLRPLQASITVGRWVAPRSAEPRRRAEMRRGCEQSRTRSQYIPITGQGTLPKENP